MSKYVLSLFILLAMPAFAATVEEDPVERQMLDIAKDLRCTVCQNQPVSESNAELARDMRAIIRDQVQAGKSRDEIVTYFVDRYGNYVLLKPQFDPMGAVLWVAPLLLLIGMGLFAYTYLRRRLVPVEANGPVLSDEDRARVREARQQEEP